MLDIIGKFSTDIPIPNSHFILEDWAVEFKGWNICRIDGKTSPLDRRAEMDRFNQGGDDPDAPILFLLSTRSGGLGINLVAADTVIFYDQDWVSFIPFPNVIE